MIELERVTVRRGRANALEGVDLRVAAGEFLSVLGPNGAGKTTLLSVLVGLVKPTAGRASVFGRPPGHRANVRIGHVPQKLAIDPRVPLSVEDAVRLGRYGRLGAFGAWGPEDQKAVDKALEAAGLLPLARKSAGTLSGGEQQKVSIARALAQEPSLYLLDEPLAHLDASSREALSDLIRRLPETTGAAVLFVTHHASHVPDGSRVALMNRGRIVREGRWPADFAGGNVEEIFRDAPHVDGDISTDYEPAGVL